MPPASRSPNGPCPTGCVRVFSRQSTPAAISAAATPSSSMTSRIPITRRPGPSSRSTSRRAPGWFLWTRSDGAHVSFNRVGASPGSRRRSARATFNPPERLRSPRRLAASSIQQVFGGGLGVTPDQCTRRAPVGERLLSGPDQVRNRIAADRLALGAHRCSSFDGIWPG
jgi:hypothetical protein